MASVQEWASAVLAGVLLKLFFTWNVTHSVQRNGNKMMHRNAP